MKQHINNEIAWFQFKLFAHLSMVTSHGIFARKGGVSHPPFASLNAGPTVNDHLDDLTENYRRIRATLPGHPLLVSAIPAQGTDMLEITEEMLSNPEGPALILPERIDAMITRVHGIGLFWAVADCSPMLVVDPVHEAIAMVHAGWRGTSRAIVANAIQRMGELYGSRPTDLLVGIGPTIGPCCYEVDEKVQTAFESHPIASTHAHFSHAMVLDQAGSTRASLRLDIAASNQAQLVSIGVPQEHIELSGFCTGCHRDLFFSNRIEEGRTGRNAAVLSLL